MLARSRTPLTRGQQIRNAVRDVGASMMGVVNAFIGAYPSTDKSRKNPFGTVIHRMATSNQALAYNLSTLVAQCRQIERGTPLGRSACEAFPAELVGSGIGILSDTGDVDQDVELIEEFNLWAEHALVDGRSLWEWQALVAREFPGAGSALARWVMLPELIGTGEIPFRILPLEVEWLSEIQVAPLASPENRFIRGIELDKLSRAVAYHLRNPEFPIYSAGERVPAEKMIHIFEMRRALQTHGEPIFAPLVERILQDSRLVETELKASISTAAPGLMIENPPDPEYDEDQEPYTDIPAGAVLNLLPGQKASAFENKRNPQAIGAFRDEIRADVSAAARLSRFWLDRDPKRANYSSMRMDQLLTKRHLASLKACIGTGAAGKVYEFLFPWLMLRRGFVMPTSLAERNKMMRYELRPDQPEYVDPVKDIAAAVNAIANNLSTHDLECSSRGRDWRQIFKQRQIEIAEAKKMGLVMPVPQTAAKLLEAAIKVDAEDAAQAAEDAQQTVEAA